MPFVQIYAVRFRNGNLHPHVNPKGWPDMVYSPSTASNQAQRIPHPQGLTLKITRGLAVDAPSAMNSIYVVPPAGNVRLDTRLFIRITFDLPRAEGLPLGDHGPLPDEFGS